ncbi:hypothetical protein ACQY0O_006087 [Thecaphora frezii]
MRLTHLVWTAALLWTLLATLVGAAGGSRDADQVIYYEDPGGSSRDADQVIYYEGPGAVSPQMYERYKALPERTALVLTDLKLDDMLAHHVLAVSKRYNRVVSVISGVNNAEGGLLVLQNFMEDMNTHETGVKFSFFHVGNPFRYAAPHEETWETWESEDPLRIPLNDREAIQETLKGRVVDIFQIAPVSPDFMKYLLDRVFSYFYLDIFFVTHGYNTRFSAGEKDKYLIEKQNRYVQTISSRIYSLWFQQQQRTQLPLAHPRVFIADSGRATFPGRDGSTLSIQKLLALGVPKKYIDLSLQDRFPERQFEKSAENLGKEVEEFREKKLIPQIWRMDPHPLRPFQIHDPMAPIYYARSQEDKLAEALRLHYRNLASELKMELETKKNYYGAIISEPPNEQLDNARKMYQDSGHLVHRLDSGVVPMFTDRKVETYDANLIIALFAALDEKIEQVHPRRVKLVSPIAGSMAIIQHTNENDVHGFGFEVPEGWIENNVGPFLARFRP